MSSDLHCLVLDGVYRRGTDGPPDFVEVPEPSDETLQALTCTYRIAFGQRAGQKELTVSGVLPGDANFKEHLRADIDRFSLHAAVRCGADERQALEELCRDIARPAWANERAQTNAAGLVELKLNTPWRDGTTDLVMSLLEFMKWLAALANDSFTAVSSAGPMPGLGRER